MATSNGWEVKLPSREYTTLAPEVRQEIDGYLAEHPVKLGAIAERLGVRVPQLASHLLGILARRVTGDWQRKYGHPIYLLETFVEQERFAGTAYRAANWIHLGQTQGRGRQGPDPRIRSASIKAIYLWPLHPRFRQLLHGATPSERQAN